LSNASLATIAALVIRWTHSGSNRASLSSSSETAAWLNTVCFRIMVSRKVLKTSV